MNNNLQKSKKKPISWVTVIAVALILAQQFRGHDSDLVKLAVYPFILCLLVWSIKPDSIYIKTGIAAVACVGGFCLWGEMTLLSIITPILSCAAAFLVQFVAKRLQKK
ncbi:MAG: hypothetical protein RRY55_09125 [Bacteroidales bacterium]